MMDTYFPNPNEHASILLDVFSGDVQAAQSLARDNQDFAKTIHEFRYWQSVEAALTPEVLCLAN
jgi:hypothetical protein